MLKEEKYLRGEVDAIVTDGFTGNIFLKTIEGMGKLIKRNLTESLKRNIFTKLASVVAMSSIKNFAKTMDYKEYGGAIFLGIKNPIIKAHGSSDENLFYYTIKQAEKYAESGANDIMIKEFEKLN